MRAMTLALGLVVAASGAGISGQISDPPVGVAGPTVISRFLDSRPQPLTQFRAVRHLEARNQRFNKHGWMDVHTELAPDGRFSFAVLAEGGSSYIRKKVLLPILEGEREIVERGGAARGAITTSNYDITSEESVGSGLVRLTLKPLRNEMTLVDGAVFVTDAEAASFESRDASLAIPRSGHDASTSSVGMVASAECVSLSGWSRSPRSASRVDRR
jgi:hypothetical protein